MSLSAIVLAAVLSAYLFLGRNLTRLVNTEHQQVQSRRTLRWFTQDVSAASALSTATTSQLDVSKPVSTGTATVSYVYDSAAGTLTRTQTLPSSSATSQVLLTGLTTFTFYYYNSGGTAVTSAPQSVKSVEISFTTAEGNSVNSTRVSQTSVSPRVVIRNKPLLQ